MTAASSLPRRRAAARAFTLVEIMVVLFIMGAVIAMAASLASALTATQRRSLTVTRLGTVDTALAQFVMQQKRLPCPADGTLLSTDNNAGAETARNSTGCTTNEQNGVVPWRALGLSEDDATDGWGRRFTYRVGIKLTADSGMDMSMCDPAGSAAGVAPNNTCNLACTSTALTQCTTPANFLASKGIQVQNKAGTVLMSPALGTGAAYVVISAGPSGGGAYLNSGVLGTSTVVDGTQERLNYANLSYTTGVTTYIDDSETDASGTTHFDDLLSRPSILTVANKAALAPRSH